MGSVELAPSAANSAAPPERARLDVLKAHAVRLHDLPMLPETAIKALGFTRDPNCSIRELSLLIERDPAVATGILRLANSPLYRTGRCIESLDQAVVKLGLRECQNLIVTVAMRSLYQKLSPSKRTRCELLWEHSYLTACICRQLNHRLSLGYRGEEFACGIAHDVGRVLIALGAPAYFELADPMNFDEGPHVLAHERHILGTDHCAFGAWFARLNELPETVVAAMEHHHFPAEAPTHQALVGLVALADDMANSLQRDPGEGYQPSADATSQFILSRWDEDRVARLFDSLPDILKEISVEVDGIVKMTGS